MTNLIESLVVYTNVAFKLMLGHATFVADKLNLPILKPITAQSVSGWQLPELAPELNGFITISDYNFLFEDGAFVGFNDRPNGGLHSIVEWPVEDRPAGQKHPPRLTSTNAMAALRVTKSALRKIGFDPSRFGASNELYVPQSSQYWFFWRTNRETAHARIYADSRRIKEFQITPALAKKSCASNFVVNVPLPPANLEIITNAVAVSCGSTNASDRQVRSALAECWRGLRQKIGVLPVQRILVEDNLNRRDLVAAELAGIARNAAYISIAWDNPPSPFPSEKIVQTALGRRGINMLAITGNPEVRIFHADFLKESDYAPLSSEAYRHAVENSIPAAIEFVRSLNIQGPAFANFGYLIPGPRVPVQRDAFAKAINTRIITVSSTPEVSPRHYSVAIDGAVRTNTPLLLVLTGAFGQRSERPYLQIPGIQLEGFLAFHENPLERTYDALGPIGLQVLRHARDVETFRLWLLDERTKRNLAKAKTIDDYPIRYAGPHLGTKTRDELADFMMREQPVSRILTMCMYDPGIAFRMTSPEGSISALVCFNCANLSWTVRDPAGKVVGGGSLDPDSSMMKRLRSIGLTAFPGFKQLRKTTSD